LRVETRKRFALGLHDADPVDAMRSCSYQEDGGNGGNQIARNEE
jgi:hypothetical protein